MSEIVSRSKLSIDYSGGSYQLKRCKSIDVSYEEDSEVVMAVGVKGGAGFRDKEGGGELTLEIYREVRPEVNYRALRDSRETFAMTLQDEDGVREQFRSCRVAGKPGRKIDESGNVMDTVKIKFLQSSINATPV